MAENPRSAGFATGVLLPSAALIIAGLLLWQLRHLLLLGFAAALLAIAFSSLAKIIDERSGIGWYLSLLVVVVAVISGVAGFSSLLGAQVTGEITQLARRAPDLAISIGNWLGLEDPWRWLEQQARRVFRDMSLLQGISGVSSVVYSTLIETLLVVAGGIYLAARPAVYRGGFLRLLPPNWRSRGASATSEVARALRIWLLGQFLAMIAVGVLTTLGLFALGIPSAIALGFLAGLLEFVPYVGPVISAVPALAVGLAESPTKAALVFALYFAIQQAEGLFIAPMIQRKAVDLPPALAVFAIIAFGIILGPMGVVLAAPLTVLSVVLVKVLWLEETQHNGDRPDRVSDRKPASETGR
ncbi:AI-2E family transporter (plasmid) [Sinorhizobium meliloti]|uniref:AI-2E family transporter n=1 Tax=Rhizobium meliloti TaxID=382 RepID=UPI002D77B77C|nr:AI-2E family transporter [Sinorhizobium meliloti]WRQ71889.1 AI-2E family transporter [Sinorhizobium meliloti]